MVKIIQSVENFIEKYGIEGTVLVGFSGGYDSMCLLDVLSKISKTKPLDIIALHLNHNWRGEESLNEAENAKNFANKLGIKFYQEVLADFVPCTETAARDARYQFFNNCAKKFNSKYVFTAHNQNDNIETIIYRFVKGTGIKGLCGISENRGVFYRPLLNISREEIEKYCIKNELKPNIDSSNSNEKYKRNFIRKNIIPNLEYISENAKTSIISLVENAKSDNKIVEEYLFKVLKKITKDGKISTEKFLKQSSEVQQRIIYNLFQATVTDYDKKKVLEILEFIKENSNLKCGKTKSMTKDLWVWVSRKYITIINSDTPILYDIEIKGDGCYKLGQKEFIMEKCSKLPEKFPEDRECIAYANMENIKFPLRFRTRRDGDIIQPLGCKGEQKLKKYFNSKGIPKHERDNIMLLAYGNEILWVAGFGLSDKIKADNQITHRLIVK